MSLSGGAYFGQSNRFSLVCAQQVGHAGTLDPLATGLLIVCTGEGTRFCDDFQVCVLAMLVVPISRMSIFLVVLILPKV